MTNAELIQTIRKEIERLENYYTSVEWYVEELLSFLSTLESEKPMNSSEHRDPCGLRGPSGVDGDKNWCLLDQEIIDWCGKFSPSIREAIQSTAYHFADWQKEQMLKEAVETELYWDGDFLAIDLNMAALGYSEKDKVRVIICKKEDGK